MFPASFKLRNLHKSHFQPLGTWNDLVAGTPSCQYMEHSYRPLDESTKQTIKLMSISTLTISTLLILFLQVEFALAQGDEVPNGVNIIIMQPDDLLFYDEWGAPPNIPNQSNLRTNMPSAGMPNIERLRLNGLQMMQAYTASPMCGTSRYSTITGKYPSRAETNSGNPSVVTIPTTKLDGNDCTQENLAAEFKANGYRTAMIGKWHLSRISRTDYTYEGAVETVKQCGFDSVAGLYVENLVAEPENFNAYSDGTFSHNMEWITHEAIQIINEDSDKASWLGCLSLFNIV